MLTGSSIAASYWWSKSIEFGCGNNGGVNLPTHWSGRATQQAFSITRALEKRVVCMGMLKVEWLLSDHYQYVPL